MSVPKPSARPRRNASASASANRSKGANDSTRTVRDTVRGSKEQPKAGAGGTLRRLLRQAVKALVQRAPAAIPRKSRRRGGDDTARRFTRAAARLTRLRVRAFRVAAALPWLADTLDWLNLWQPDAGEWLDNLPQEPPNNQLSPRL